MALIPTEYHFPLSVKISMISSMKIECEQKPSRSGVVLGFKSTPSPDLDKMQAALQDLAEWAEKHSDVVTEIEADVIK